MRIREQCENVLGDPSVVASFSVCEGSRVLMCVCVRGVGELERLNSGVPIP